jgi:hydrogenase maturation protein HypF
MARFGTNAPPTSSMGRLFDAVASIAGLHDTVTFEGQAAIALEQAAIPHLGGHHDAAPMSTTYKVGIDDGSPRTIDGSQLVRQVLDDVSQGLAAGVVAARFHASIVRLIVDMCGRIRDDTELDTVALSGGVFQNALLVRGCVDQLSRTGFTVLTHRQVPPNDGGISLGQAVVAAARLRNA